MVETMRRSIFLAAFSVPLISSTMSGVREATQTLQGLVKGQVLDPHEKRQDITVRLAPKAVKCLVLRVNHEGGGLIAVEGTVPTEVGPALRQGHGAGHEILDPHLALQVVDFATAPGIRIRKPA